MRTFNLEPVGGANVPRALPLHAGYMRGNKEETAEGGSLTSTLKETMIRPFWCLFKDDNEFMVSVPV